jgi:glutamate--cysteine ligase
VDIPPLRLDEEQLLADLRSHAFAPSAGPPRIGLEVEMLAFRGIQAVSVAEIEQILEPLVATGELMDQSPSGGLPCYGAGGARLTFEPGGQLELISAPHASVADALGQIASLERLLDRVLIPAGIRRANHGMNPWQDAEEVELQTPLPRYRAMQQYFSRLGPDGVRMMRLCCALQINLDSGDGAEVERRWRLANLMSPVLIAMFANSPIAEGRITGWKSTRAGVVHRMDPGRVGLHCEPVGPEDYLAFALDACVMIRRTADDYRVPPLGMRFRDWLDDGDELGFPDLDDWHYHCTTLFPQVRPRGFFEMRALDTAPVRWRAVSVALVSALLIDPYAREAALTVMEAHASELAALTLVAARKGPSDPLVGRLARVLMSISLDALSRMPADWITPQIEADVVAYDERYIARGRCPADELLDLHASGRTASEAAREVAEGDEAGPSAAPWPVGGETT